MSMMQPESSEKKKGLLDRLPKLGRLSQFILIIGIFLVILIPLWIFNQQQPARQDELNSTLANLQKILSVQESPKAKFESELAQATADLEAAGAAYPNPTQAPEILDSLLALAQQNDIYITQTSVSTSTLTGAIGPVLTFALGLKGQIPKFQNFLLALDTKLPTSQITQATFTAAQSSQEYDTAAITINVLCYGGGK
jgi:cytoskeletal protein RodZ